MNRLITASFYQHLDGAQHTLPHPRSIKITRRKQLVHSHGREDRRVLPVLVDEELDIGNFAFISNYAQY